MSGYAIILDGSGDGYQERDLTSPGNAGSELSSFTNVDITYNSGTATGLFRRPVVSSDYYEFNCLQSGSEDIIWAIGGTSVYNMYTWIIKRIKFNNIYCWNKLCTIYNIISIINTSTNPTRDTPMPSNHQQ